MATSKIITVTVSPTLTGDTIAYYNAYSSIDGLLGTLSVAEAAAGKDFSLSDGATHSITVKVVWTTAGETTTVGSNAVSVTTSVTAIYAITTDATTNQFFETEDKFYFPGDFYIEFRNQQWLGTNANLWYLGHDSGVGTTVNGAFGIKCDGNNLIEFRVTDVDVTIKAVSDIAVAAGDLIKIERVGADFNLRINGTIQATIATTGFVGLDKVLCFGAVDNIPNYLQSVVLSELDINGETWDFSEQTGLVAVGSSGSNINLRVGTGSETTMWSSI